MDATGDIEITEYDAMNKEFLEDLFGVDGSLDPFQAKPKIPRTPDSVGSNRSRPVSGDVPLPTRSVSPPVPKPSSRGQDSVKCYQDCLKACRNLKKRHFHCKICDYMSERLDNMKRHIPYHFMKLKKERQRAPDGIKMVCHEYFTETCNSDGCSYSQKSYPHLHCTLCKSWACNIKKSYKYRLQHLNRSHCMFFTEKENPTEILNDKHVSKKIDKLSRPEDVKLMTYPAAEADVLHSRRRRGSKRTSENQILGTTEQAVAGSSNDEKDMSMDYIENVGNDVRSIIQPLETGSPSQEEANAVVDELTTTGCPRASMESDADTKKVLLHGQEQGSTFSVTLNGDLSTIISVLMSVKKKGIAIKNQSLREIISRNPSCSTKELLRNLSLISKSKGKRRKVKRRTKKAAGKSKEDSLKGSSAINEGLFEAKKLPSDLPVSTVNEARVPPDDEAKGVTVETDKILEYLSKMFGTDSRESLFPDISKDTSKIWEELCNGINTDFGGVATAEEVPSSTAPKGKCRAKKARPAKAPIPRGKNIKTKTQKSSVSNRRKKGNTGPKKGVKRGVGKSKKPNVISDSTEVIESSQNKRFVFQTIDIDSDILMNKESYEALDIYDIINGYVRNEDLLDVNCNNI